MPGSTSCVVVVSPPAGAADGAAVIRSRRFRRAFHSPGCTRTPIVQGPPWRVGKGGLGPGDTGGGGWLRASRRRPCPSGMRGSVESGGTLSSPKLPAGSARSALSAGRRRC